MINCNTNTYTAIYEGFILQVIYFYLLFYSSIFVYLFYTFVNKFKLFEIKNNMEDNN